MKKVLILSFLMFSCFYALFSQATDEQIRQAASILGVPYADLRQFVQSYQSNTSTDIIIVDVSTLSQAYQTNPVRADIQYKGRTLRVTGVVSRFWPREIDLIGATGTGNVRITYRQPQMYYPI